MSAREMERCECQEGHTGPLVVLVDVRCSAGCGMERRTIWCSCCSGEHSIPLAAPVECFRDSEHEHGICGAQVLLALEPLAAGVGP
jgi:hypothetical protein